jgi:hypothetical protein
MGTPQLHVVGRSVAANLDIAQLVHEATNEDVEGYIEGLHRSAQLEGGNVCKAIQICRGVRIRKIQDL